MKRKEARCRFNAARSHVDHFNPVCTYLQAHPFKLPPHVTFVFEPTTPKTCTHCKCFEDVNDE